MTSPTLAETPAAAFANADPVFSDTGHVQLNWTARGNAPVRLMLYADDEAARPRSLYEGTNQAYFLSGLPNGVYRAHLIDPQDGATLDALELRVAHPPLGQAFALLLMGGLVTLATIIVIWHGHHREASHHG